MLDNGLDKSAMKTLRPSNPRGDDADCLHGVEVPDPYRILENPNDPRVRAWMAAQDAYARAYLEALPDRDALEARLREILYQDAMVTPWKRAGEWYFYLKRLADKEKKVLYRQKGLEGAPQVVIDPNTFEEETTALGSFHPSPDGRLLAYTLHPDNADEAWLHVLDLETGRDRTSDIIPGARYASPSWLPDSSGFYYVGLPVDPSIPIDQLPGYAESRFHRIGDDHRTDRVVHPRTNDPRTFQSVTVSEDGSWLTVSIARGWSANTIFFRPRDAGDAAWQPLTEGMEALFDLHVWDGAFYVLTNHGAPNARVFRVDPAHPERRNWIEIVPERDDRVIQSLHIYGGTLVLHLMKAAASLLEIRDLDGSHPRTVALPSLGTISSLHGRAADDLFFLSFTSFTIPLRIYRVDVTTGALAAVSQAGGESDADTLAVKQVWYPSKDGTPISMFIVHKKDLQLDGRTPFWLTGYGGFSLSRTPDFSAARMVWLERGGGFALPNLRGGGEYGEKWHQAGMLAKKQNVFDDFIAAAAFLIERRYTSPQRLIISGGSNGGLLVGAAMTQRPDLFGAVVCSVPLLDMIRYHLFGAGRTWIPEYGSAEDPEQFAYLLAYSPYHHVKKGIAYPPLLMISADHDDRVDPMHARKMVAAVQDANPEGLALLRIEAHAGHGGVDVLSRSIRTLVDTLAFMLDNINK